MNYYVLYSCLGKDMQVGPYTKEQAILEHRDIAGYEAVFNARVAPESELPVHRPSLKERLDNPVV